MESKLLSTLALPAGSRLLDAGCGSGLVSLYMAEHGMQVTGVDVLDHHIAAAQRNIERSGLPKGQITMQRMDFPRLESISSASYDGIYTLQAFGHSTHPKLALEGFFRIMKPGGKIALVEVESRREPRGEREDELSELLRHVSEFTALPQNELSKEGYFKTLLEDAGFVDIEVRDWSENIRPIVRLFYVLVFLPFLFVELIGMEKRFVNMVAATTGYLGLGKRWCFMAISARKPGGKVDGTQAK